MSSEDKAVQKATFLPCSMNVLTGWELFCSLRVNKNVVRNIIGHIEGTKLLHHSQPSQ